MLVSDQYAALFFLLAHGQLWLYIWSYYLRISKCRMPDNSSHSVCQRKLYEKKRSLRSWLPMPCLWLPFEIQGFYGFYSTFPRKRLCPKHRTRRTDASNSKNSLDNQDSRAVSGLRLRHSLPNLLENKEGAWLIWKRSPFRLPAEPPAVH